MIPPLNLEKRGGSYFGKSPPPIFLANGGVIYWNIPLPPKLGKRRCRILEKCAVPECGKKGLSYFGNFRRPLNLEKGSVISWKVPPSPNLEKRNVISWKIPTPLNFGSRGRHILDKAAAPKLGKRGCHILEMSAAPKLWKRGGWATSTSVPKMFGILNAKFLKFQKSTHPL